MQQEGSTISMEEKYRTIEAPPDTITFPCVVLIYPTLKKQEELGEGYYLLEGMSNNNLKIARMFLDSIHADVIDAESEGILHFKTADQTVFNLDLNQFSWGLVLFDGTTDPLSLETDVVSTSDSSFYKTYYRHMVADSLFDFH